jgi:hypothetical protein
VVGRNRSVETNKVTWLDSDVHNVHVDVNRVLALGLNRLRGVVKSNRQFGIGEKISGWYNRVGGSSLCRVHRNLRAVLIPIILLLPIQLGLPPIHINQTTCLSIFSRKSALSLGKVTLSSYSVRTENARNELRTSNLLTISRITFLTTHLLTLTHSKMVSSMIHLLVSLVWSFPIL